MSESVCKRADSLNHLVILTLLRDLDRAVTEAESLPLHSGVCTYARFKGDYVYWKVALTRLHQEDGGRRSSVRLYGDLLTATENATKRIESLRVLLYTNPCRKCSVCLTRVKPWRHTKTTHDGKKEVVTLISRENIRERL